MGEARGGETSLRAAETPALDSPLAGRHAVVTGGGRGIGAAVAARLASMGAAVTLIGRDRAVLEAKRAELDAAHAATVAAIAADVCDESAVERAFDAAAGALGAPAILVNNAGAAQSAPFKRTDAALWRAASNLSHCEIRKVLTEHKIRWQRSTGSLEELELAERPFQLYEDHRYVPEPYRAFLAPQRSHDVEPSPEA